MKERERGFALIAVLLVMTVVGILGAEFAYSMRLEASAVRAYKESIVAGHLAEAGFEQALRELAADAPWAALDDDGALTFYTRERAALPRLPRVGVALGGGQYTYRITDEAARINVNTATPERIDRLLQELGIDKRERDVIGDSIQDWRDANEDHRLNGAESDDTYLKLPVPYRARNANLESVAELLQIKGVMPLLFHGAEGRPGLADVLTVKTPGQVNLNTAGPQVLRALGFSDAEITEVVQSRRETPYASVPPRFAGRGLVVVTQTFRIQAEGLIDGRSRARLTAIVQKRMQTGAPALVVVEWSGVQ